MFNTQEYNKIVVKIIKIQEEREILVKEFDDAEKYQRRVFFWGSLALLLITCAATVFAYPRMTKFGMFICALVSCLGYLFFIISQHFTGEGVQDVKDKIRTKEREFKIEAKKLLEFFGNCFT